MPDTRIAAAVSNVLFFKDAHIRSMSEHERIKVKIDNSFSAFAHMAAPKNRSVCTLPLLSKYK